MFQRTVIAGKVQLMQYRGKIAAEQFGAPLSPHIFLAVQF
jgi:hypothetical protein